MRFKRGLGVLALCLLMVAGMSAPAQSQYLQINGSTVDSLTIGTPFQLKYTFGTSASAKAEVWLDLDGDLMVGPSDYLLFESFSEDEMVTDGGPDDETGPGDGVWERTFSHFFMIAPATYLIRVIEGSSVNQVVLILKPDPSSKIVRGKVTTPSNAANLLVLLVPDMPSQPDSLGDGFPPPPDSGYFPPPDSSGNFPPPDSSGMNPPPPPGDTTDVPPDTSNMTPPPARFAAVKSHFAKQVDRILQNDPMPFDCNFFNQPDDDGFFPIGAITDSTGSFQVSVPPALVGVRWMLLVVDIFANYNNYFPPPLLPVDLTTDTVDVALDMKPTTSYVKISVKDYFGDAIKNALGDTAEVEVAVFNEFAGSMTYRRTVNGVAVLPALPGNNQFDIKANLFGMYLRPVNDWFANVNMNDTVKVDLVLLPVDNWINGRVTIENRDPASCIHLYAETDQAPYVSHAVTNDSGYYSLAVNSTFQTWKVILDVQTIPYGYWVENDVWQILAKPGERYADFNLVRVDSGGPGPGPGPCPDPWNNPAEFAPKVVRVKDIPNDQGLQVRVVWRGSKVERGGQNCDIGIGVEYGVWRRGPAIPDSGSAPPLGKAKAHKVKSFDEAYQLAKQLGPGSTFRIEGQRYLWDFVVSVPGAHLPLYAYVAPTLYDSTANNPGWSYFRVSVHLAMNSFVIFSEPDSGYSVDNLAPVLQNVQVRLVGNGVRMSWETPNSPDVVATRIYRSNQPNFDLKNATLVGVTTENEFFDPNGTDKHYYRIVVEDDAGNVTSTDAVPAKVTGIVSRGGLIPDDYVLDQNYPNPFNPSTRISFGLPEMGRVRLDIFDLMGRHVRTLVDGELNAGMYEVVWDGRDNRGQKVATGIYLYKLQAPDALLQKKMILSK